MDKLATVYSDISYKQGILDTVCWCFEVHYDNKIYIKSGKTLKQKSGSDCEEFLCVRAAVSFCRKELNCSNIVCLTDNSNVINRLDELMGAKVYKIPRNTDGIKRCHSVCRKLLKCQ